MEVRSQGWCRHELYRMGNFGGLAVSLCTPSAPQPPGAKPTVSSPSTANGQTVVARRARHSTMSSPTISTMIGVVAGMVEQIREPVTALAKVFDPHRRVCQDLNRARRLTTRETHAR